MAGDRDVAVAEAEAEHTAGDREWIRFDVGAVDAGDVDDAGVDEDIAVAEANAGDADGTGIHDARLVGIDVDDAVAAIGSEVADEVRIDLLAGVDVERRSLVPVKDDRGCTDIDRGDVAADGHGRGAVLRNAEDTKGTVRGDSAMGLDGRIAIAEKAGADHAAADHVKSQHIEGLRRRK